MTDRLSLIEQGQASQAEFLDQIAQALRVLEDRSGIAQRDEFEARLSPSWPVRTGEQGAGGLGARSDVARSLGNTEPYTGRANLLRDPTLEQWPEGAESTIPLLGSGTLQLGPHWRAWKLSQSGTAPTFVLASSALRGVTSSPLNSSQGRLRIGWGAATGSVTVLFRANAVGVETALPFIVGAARFAEPELSTPSDFDVTAYVMVVDSSNAITATSDTLDLTALGIGDTLRAHAAEQVAPGDYGRFIDIKITVTRVATTGGVASTFIFFGDPQLNTTYTPDPLPYAPLLGAWFPDRLEGRTAVFSQDTGTTPMWRISGVSGTTSAGLEFRAYADSLSIPARLALYVNDATQQGTAQVTIRAPGGANPNAGAEIEYQKVEWRHWSASDYPLVKLAAVQPTGGFLDNAEFVVSTGTAGAWTEGLRVRGFPSGLVSTPHAVKALGYQVGVNAVVGARRTGWTPATGTATRTTFVTSTVTLPQLAERVKALLDDLHATAGHGLIGT